MNNAVPDVYCKQETDW